jgi:hypothetical protein
MRKKFFILLSALVAMVSGVQAATDYGFSVRGYRINSDNYQEQSSGAAWSYDPSANVLHLKNGTIISDTNDAIQFYGDVNPTLNVSVDGNCELSGKFNTGIVFNGKGTHTFYGKGTLTIRSSVVNPNGITGGSTPSTKVTFKDLTVNIKQYGGVGFNVSGFGSITFDWCDFNITTSDGMAMRGSEDACTPHLILCLADRSWGSGSQGSGYRGISGEGLYASNVKITRAIKYVGVKVAAPVAGQKSATTATTISSGYKVTSVTWTKKIYSHFSPMEENETFQIGQIYRASFNLEAQGDSLFNYTDDSNAAAIVTVNGNKPDFFRANNTTAAYISYTFPEVDGIRYDLWVGGKQVTETNKDDILENGIAAYNPSTKTLTLKGGTINGQGVSNDGTTGFGAGIYSKVDGLIIDQQASTMLRGVYECDGMILQGNTTLKGKGTMSASGYMGISLGIGAYELTVDGDLILIAMGNTSSGMVGYHRLKPKENWFSTLTVKGNSTVVVSSGDKAISLKNFKDLILVNHAITVPDDALWIADQHAVCDKDGNPIIGYVAIEKVANPADVNKDGTVDSADIVAVIKEMPNGDKKADVNSDGAIDSADIVAVIKAMK